MSSIRSVLEGIQNRLNLIRSGSLAGENNGDNHILMISIGKLLQNDTVKLTQIWRHQTYYIQSQANRSFSNH